MDGEVGRKKKAIRKKMGREKIKLTTKTFLRTIAAPPKEREGLIGNEGEKKRV